MAPGNVDSRAEWTFETYSLPLYVIAAQGTGNSLHLAEFLTDYSLRSWRGKWDLPPLAGLRNLPILEDSPGVQAISTDFFL